MTDPNPPRVTDETLAARALPGPAAAPAGGQRDDLLTMIRKLWRRHTIVLACIIVTGAIAFAVVKGMTPIYAAMAEVLVGSPITDAGAVGATDRLRIDSEAVQSQARIMTSRTIAARVVDRLALDTYPEFNPFLRKEKSPLRGFGSSAESPTKLPTRAPGVPRERQVELTTDVLLSKISALPTDRSHVLNVRVESEDPQLAARIANAVANIYIEQTIVHQTEMTQKANAWLQSEIRQLRDQVDENERAVEEYRREHGLYEANATTVSAQQMGELNSQLIMAESAKVEADTRLAQAEAVLNSGGALDSIPEVVNSPLIQALEQREADIQRQVADLSSVYGPMHPRIENINAQLRDTRGKIRSETQKIVSSLRSAAATSQARYEALQSRLENAKTEVSESNVDSVELRHLQREAEASRVLFTNLLERYKRSAAQEQFQQTNAWVISPAAAPVSPSFPPTMPILAAALLLGALIGALLVFLIEMLDRTFRTSDDVVQTTGLPSLALIPTIRKSARRIADSAHDTTSPFGEAIHKLRMRMLFSNDGETPKVTMFTSAEPDEGKSLICVSLARQLAQTGRRVIIIDGDLRRPTLHMLLNARNGPGLVDLLYGRATPDETVYRDDATGVHAIFAGRMPNGENVLPDVSRLQMLLASLSKYYDTVILDAPPILVGAEVIHYAQLVDTTIFVARWGRTRKEVVLEALRPLIASGAPIAGMALTQVNPKRYKQYASVNLHYDYPVRRKAGALS